MKWNYLAITEAKKDMKNYEIEVDNTLQDLHNSSYPTETSKS